MSAWETIIIDLSDIARKRELLSRLGRLQGLHEIRIKERRRVRSNPQNAWYWGCIVESFVLALEEQWGETVTPADAHEMLRDKFLSVQKTHINEETGVFCVITRRVSSAKLDTREFSEYCEKCRDFLADWFGVIVPDPDPCYYAGEEQGGK